MDLYEGLRDITPDEARQAVEIHVNKLLQPDGTSGIARFQNLPGLGFIIAEAIDYMIPYLATTERDATMVKVTAGIINGAISEVVENRRMHEMFALKLPPKPDA